jgi:hypothetical protein
MDGSRERLAALADLCGCSLSWLVACRITSAAWPLRERRLSVGWPVHRKLSARPDRFVLLGRFVRQCARDGVTPSGDRLGVWLAERTPRYCGFGRPRLDPVVKVERLALALDRESLRRLVERLSAALAVPVAVA